MAQAAPLRHFFIRCVLNLQLVRLCFGLVAFFRWCHWAKRATMQRACRCSSHVEKCWKFIFPSGSWFRPARKSVENHVAPPLWGHQCAVPRLLHPCRVVQGITVEMETGRRSKNWMPQNRMKTSNSSPKWQCFFFCIDKWTVSWLHSLHSPQKITEFARVLTDFWMPWSLRLSASNFSPFGLTSARSRCRAVHIIGAGLGNSAVIPKLLSFEVLVGLMGYSGANGNLSKL